MSPATFLAAARVPEIVTEDVHGLWMIERLQHTEPLVVKMVGGTTQTILSRWDDATIHQPRGEIVMDDSNIELCRHIPAWLAAQGRVLVTGLGLGCVVRGLLANPRVEHVDVVEIDSWIITKVGPSVADPRVTIHHCDAREFTAPAGVRYELAWHDVHRMEPGDPNLAVTHAALIKRFKPVARRQGAWGWPREIKGLFRRKHTSLVGVGRP